MVEFPQAPESIQKELREFDPRLRVVFNGHYGVWQVEQRLRDGSWSHVMYWCDLIDGDYKRKVRRDLPGTASPLIVEIQKRDVSKAERGGDILGHAKMLDEQNATERSRKMVEMSTERKRRFESWDRLMRNWAPRLVSMHNRGGGAAGRALKERFAIRRDLGIGGG